MLETLANTNTHDALPVANNTHFTDKLVENLGIQKSSDCPICRGLGLISESHTHDSKAISSFQLCSCVQQLCENKRCQPPYERYKSELKSLAPCECRSARINLEQIQLRAKRAHIPPRYAHALLDHIQHEHISGSGLMIALDHAEERVLQFRKAQANQFSMYIHGGTGCGKTLLACAILNELLRFYKARVRYAKISRDILGKIRSTFNPNSGDYGTGFKIEKELAHVDALVIDDFGIHKETPWVDSILYDLIDARYENNLFTIITSNHPLNFWKTSAEGRIFSRLREMCSEIMIDAPDYRTTVAHGISY